LRVLEGMVSVQELNNLMKKYTEEMGNLISKGDYDGAISLAMRTLEELLSVARSDVVGVLGDATVRTIADGLLTNYEKTLSYARGVYEGLKYMAPIYQPGEKLQLLQVLSSAVSELFSFIIGALLVIASLTGPSARTEQLGVV